MRIAQAYGSIKKSDHDVSMKVNGRLAFIGQMNDNILCGRNECAVIITVKEDSQPKTNKQLRYYFGVVVPYCMMGYRALGWDYDKEKTDTELRLMYHHEEVTNTQTGENKKYIASLSKASKKDLIEFIDNCVRFAIQELGIMIPAPEDKDEHYKID